MKMVFLMISGITLLSCHLITSFECLLQHLSSIHIAARTAIDDDYLFHFLLCFNLFDYSAWIADSHHI